MTEHGFTVERFESIDSTNTYLMDRSRSGAPAGLVAVADFQTAGRGRLDRRWEAPPGSCLLTSILLREPLPADELHLATAAVALAAAAAIASLSGREPEIKWPNDLLFDGLKIAGVLAEADTADWAGAPGSTAIVVGIGINLTWPGPPDVGGTSVEAATGVGLGRDELLESLLIELEELRPLLASAGGRSALSRALEQRTATIGQMVRVELGTGVIEGRATGINRFGHLLVDVEGEARAIAAGDVVHLRPSLPPPV
jgi:BirA family biotin operon repressor/biotin-[acetyl-CoA-carboxylase] ligase